MPERDLALLVEAARLAGRVALQFWGKSPQVWDKPDGQGPVTEADLAVNAALEDLLRTARPDYGWLSEESPDTADRLSCDQVFIIDPIDGTRAFIGHDPGFSHSLAIARQGVVTAAVVYLPARNRLYAARAGTTATRDAGPVQVAERDQVEGATLLTSKADLAEAQWIGRPPQVTRVFRPSLAHRLCLVADGTFDGLLTLRPTWEWDIAAGALITERAGATLTDRRGAAVQFNRAIPMTDGLLVASPGLHGRIAPLLKR